MSNEEFRNHLLLLIKKIGKIIEKEKNEGKIQPSIQIYQQWKATGFKYDESGISVGKSGIQVSKTVWFFVVPMILDLIKSEDEYQICQTNLQNHSKNQEYSVLFDNFVQYIIRQILERDQVPQDDLERLIDNLLLELNNKPIKSCAKVHLLGLILIPDIVEIAPGITLTKPKKEDFEVEIPLFAYNPIVPFSDPTAFLEITIQTKNPQDLHEEIMRTIALLRLFRTAGVHWLKYEMFSDSFSPMGFGRTTLTSPLPPPVPPLKVYTLKDEDILPLQKFWRTLSTPLPQKIYRAGKTDHISIAYDRYTDSLLQNDSEERRITNAIMGLEALYFRPSGELQELQYRLAIRIAKTLKNFSLDPLRIKNTVKDAYSIRSIFSHGGHLNYKQKSKYNEKYEGDINNLLKTVLDYLRLSIIISIMIHQEKEEFIDILDNALINDSDNQRLVGILHQAKNILE